MRRLFQRKQGKSQDEEADVNSSSDLEAVDAGEETPNSDESGSEQTENDPAETVLAEEIFIDEQDLVEEGAIDEEMTPAEETESTPKVHVGDLTRPIAVPNIEQTAVSLKPVKQPEKQSENEPLLKATHQCNVGRIRSRNEDSTFIFTAEGGGQEPLPPFGLYIVADGMGGHHAGHEASRNVSRLVARYVMERIYLPLINASIGSSSDHQEPINDVMLDAVQAANKRIHNDEPEKDSGTTLTAALIIGRRLYVAHVGDSRAYLLVDGELKQVTKDHSYIQRLQDTGQISEEEAAIHPQRNVLYRAVGQGDELEIDAFTQTLPQRGQLIICSDGLWGLVPNDRILEVLEQELSLEDKSSRLVDIALAAGGHDNVSVVLAEFNY
jgi:serine/threonine protein phosphatase PrpC